MTEQWRDLTMVGDGTPHETLTIGPAALSVPVGIRVRDEPAEELGANLASRVTLTAMNHLRGRAVLLHAAAVALDDGRVIGFVGPSGRGKTTAVSELAKSHRYVTDETLAVLEDGTVVPYPKPLLIGRRPSPKQAVAASTHGLRAYGGGPLRLAALVLLDRRDGVVTTEVTRVGIVEALMGLARESSHLSALDAPLAHMTEMISATGGVRRVRYSEAATLPGVIDEILAASDDEPVAFSAVRRADPAAAEPPCGSYRAAAHHDAIVVDEHLVVLRHGEITAVGGIAELLWSAADDATESELLAAVVRDLPAAPPGIDPRAAVSDALKALVEAGLLTRALSG